MVALRFALLTIWNQFPLHSVRKSQWLGLDDPYQNTVSSCFYTAQKMKFFIKDFFSKCDQIRSFLRTALVTFTEEILNGKLHFLCSVKSTFQRKKN